MKIALVRGLGSLLVGLVGWLAIGAMHLDGEVNYLAAFGLGVIAGTCGRWPLGPIALLIGIAASYPVMLASGVIAFLGENWELYGVLLALLAVAGFAVGDALVRRPRRAEGS